MSKGKNMGTSPISHPILKVFFLLLVPYLLLNFSCKESPVKKMPKAVNGILNLTDWDFENDGIVQLNGEWEFYREQLLIPDGFAVPDIPQKTGSR